MEKAPRKGKKLTTRVRKLPDRVVPRVRKAPDTEIGGEIRMGRRNVLLLLASLGVILVGFLALAMGSTSISAILLVGGYLALVPWAILAKPASEDKPDSPEGPYLKQ